MRNVIRIKKTIKLEDELEALDALDALYWAQKAIPSDHGKRELLLAAIDKLLDAIADTESTRIFDPRLVDYLCQQADFLSDNLETVRDYISKRDHIRKRFVMPVEEELQHSINHTQGC